MEELNLQEFRRQQLINVNIDAVVRKYKSIHRAVRRCKLSEWFEEYPKRPFNNRKPTSGRSTNEYKKRIYYAIKGKIY